MKLITYLIANTVLLIAPAIFAQGDGADNSTAAAQRQEFKLEELFLPRGIPDQLATPRNKNEFCQHTPGQQPLNKCLEELFGRNAPVMLCPLFVCDMMLLYETAQRRKRCAEAIFNRNISCAAARECQDHFKNPDEVIACFAREAEKSPLIDERLPRAPIQPRVDNTSPRLRAPGQGDQGSVTGKRPTILP